MRVIAAVFGVVALLASQVGAASLVGQWTFDGNGGTGALENKAPGVSWSPLSFTGVGAEVSEDGKLVLPRYQEGAWKQSSATAMLKTDLGPGGYFKEMTQVIWIKWPGFDTSSTGVWASLAGMVKVANEDYDVTNQSLTKSAQRIVMKATDNWNWGANRVYETSGTAVGTQWAKNGGVDPPVDRYIKIAQVVKVWDAARYSQTMYWDIGDGNGLVAVGTENAALWNAYVMPFGQYATDCIPFAGGGLRYDAFGFMDYSWSVPQSAGEILFEEARVYAGAMTTAEMGALAPTPFVPVPEPSALLALAIGVLGVSGSIVRRRK